MYPQVGINIIEAQKLVGVNINPFVVIRVGEEKRHTATQKSTNCPFYNEVHAMDRVHHHSVGASGRALEVLLVQLLSGEGICGVLLGAQGSVVFLSPFSTFCLNSTSQGKFYFTDS